MSFIEQIVLNRLWNAYDYEYVYTKTMYWKWKQKYFAFLKSFMYRRQYCQKDPCTHNKKCCITHARSVVGNVSL